MDEIVLGIIVVLGVIVVIVVILIMVICWLAMENSSTRSALDDMEQRRMREQKQQQHETHYTSEESTTGNLRRRGPNIEAVLAWAEHNHDGYLSEFSSPRSSPATSVTGLDGSAYDSDSRASTPTPTVLFSNEGNWMYEVLKALYGDYTAEKYAKMVSESNSDRITDFGRIHHSLQGKGYIKSVKSLVDEFVRLKHLIRPDVMRIVKELAKMVYIGRRQSVEHHERMGVGDEGHKCASELWKYVCKKLSVDIQ